MKPIFLSTLSILLLLTAAGCGANQDPQPSTSASPSPSDTSPQQQPEEPQQPEGIAQWEKEVVSDKPGATVVQYLSLEDGSVLLELQNAAEEHDLDGDGQLEIVEFTSQDNVSNIVIYDMEEEELLRTDVQQALQTHASDYAGNIGNLKEEYRQCVSVIRITEDGTQVQEIYQYQPDAFLYQCPLEEALT
ncbi:MAG: hypothetical protein ACOX7F_01090 [Eubacteriales bacterium]|jgi:glucose/arabinose dehydrogenase